MHNTPLQHVVIINQDGTTMDADAVRAALGHAVSQAAQAFVEFGASIEAWKQHRRAEEHGQARYTRKQWRRKRIAGMLNSAAWDA